MIIINQRLFMTTFVMEMSFIGKVKNGGKLNLKNIPSKKWW